MSNASFEPLAENLWLKSYPLSVLGTSHGRNVTLIRLKSGRVVVHSMAPFSDADLADIRSKGDLGWLVESMLLHDTYAREGREKLPGLPFYGPRGFGEVVKFDVLPLETPPDEWAGELEVIPLEGAPRLQEIPMLHVPTKTLIVADLIFNFDPHETGWNRFFHRYVAGFKRYPGTSRIFKLFVKDHAAFKASIQKLLAADFDRIIVGHGRLIETGGKAMLRQAMADAGFIES